ncbi:MAG: tail fiber domain-containing protein, partial [Actinobacteria bacterium]
PNTITLDNINQITSRSHTALSDIGTNTHAQIDTHLAATTNVHGLTYTAEGTGGGLDADTVDGSEATAFPLLAGRAGGQTLYGGTASGDDLTLESTSDATKGYVNINPNGGNVGIGTASPTTKLDISGSARVTGNTAPTSGAGIEFNYGGIADSGIVMAYDRTGGSYKDLYIRGSKILFDQNTTNVGFGTTNPGAKLDVNPTITATSDYTDIKSGIVYNGASAMTNWYGEYVAAPTGTGTITNKYALVTEANAGNVGIGTIAPAEKLQVNGVVKTQSIQATSNSAAATGAGAELMYSSGVGYLQAYSRPSSGYQPVVVRGSTVGLGGGGATDSLYVNSSGNVGIGTAGPEQKLHVSGQSQFIDTSGYNNRAIIIGRTTTDAAAKSSAVTSRHWLNAEEPATLIGSAIDDVTNSYVNIGGGYSNNNSATALRFYTAADNVTLSGTERMRIDSSGNVGIGATSPGTKLDVQGQTFRIGGDIGAYTLRTDATNKAGFFITPHYTNAEESIQVFSSSSTATDNAISIGGGSASNNAATYIRFLTAANNTTTTGTEQMRIDSSGNVNITSLTASKAVFTDASKNLTSTGTLGADQGGTGLTSYTTGDLIYASGATSLAKLSDVATGYYLASGGVGAAPTWSAISSIDHGSLGGLSDDDHTGYALLAGRSGGQTLYGGTAASENLTLGSTSHATKGNVNVVGGNSNSILKIENSGTGGAVGLTLRVNGSDRVSLWENNAYNNGLLIGKPDGTIRSFFDVTTGNVGINTTNIASKLDVTGTISSTTAVATYTASKTTTTITATVGTFTSADVGRFFVWADGTIDTITAYISGTEVTVANSGTISSQQGYTKTANFYVNSSGNVGIGTTNPTYKADLYSSSSDDMIRAVTERNVANSAPTLLYHKRGINTALNDKMKIYLQHDKNDLSGVMQAGFGTVVENPAAGAGLGMAFYSGGMGDANERIRIASNGNVGIGTTGPVDKLDVSNGNLRVWDSAVITTSKYDSQGVALASDLHSIILNGGSTDRPEISWYRGNRDYPEFSIREHATVDTGATIFAGNGQVAPTATMSIISGSVGIGTPSPKVKLQSTGAAATTSPTLGSATGGGFYLTNTDINYGLLAGVGGGGVPWLQAQRTDGTATAYNLLLQPSGGNVGIGTSSSLTHKLDILGSSTTTLNGLRVQNTDTTAGAETLFAMPAYNGASALQIRQSTNATGPSWAVGGYDSIIRTGQTNSYLHFASGASNNPQMTIKPGGLVGIGTTNPGTKLAVSGLTGTSSYNYVRVNTSTGDFYYDSSSARYKANIKNLVSKFSNILKLKPKSFTDKASKEKELGYIAEDLDRLGLKDLVIYKKGRPDALKYDKIPIYTLEVVKAHEKQIKMLKNKFSLNKKGNLIVPGNLEVKGHIIASKDTKGRLTIDKGEKDVTYTFKKAYKKSPVVTITPTSDPGNVRYWVTATKKHLYIHLSKASSEELRFNYIVLE